MGVLIQKMNLGQTGWLIMLIWVIWTIIVPLIFELLKMIFKPPLKLGESHKRLFTVKYL
jgi:hypothetical protein